MITIRKGKAWRVSGKVVNLLEILDRESSTSSAIRALDVLASKAAGLERDLSRGITPWLRPEMRANKTETRRIIDGINAQVLATLPGLLFTQQRLQQRAIDRGDAIRVGNWNDAVRLSPVALPAWCRRRASAA